MKVADLERILSEVKDKQVEVVMAGYYDTEVNGYYMDTKDDKAVLVLTRLNVQPRVA